MILLPRFLQESFGPVSKAQASSSKALQASSADDIKFWEYNTSTQVTALSCGCPNDLRTSCPAADPFVIVKASSPWIMSSQEDSFHSKLPMHIKRLTFVVSHLGHKTANRRPNNNASLSHTTTIYTFFRHSPFSAFGCPTLVLSLSFLSSSAYNWSLSSPAPLRSLFISPCTTRLLPRRIAPKSRVSATSTTYRFARRRSPPMPSCSSDTAPCRPPRRPPQSPPNAVLRWSCAAFGRSRSTGVSCGDCTWRSKMDRCGAARLSPNPATSRRQPIAPLSCGPPVLAAAPHRFADREDLRVSATYRRMRRERRDG
ncbi:hypothetical protein B0H15DRAFT_148661 [Mycena belliarum]|uniref:Uncharacterized protein n=1 Tax=Mycena belliarum TaxID=1033014 RepID=A0AAD6UD34_9AGAR|nr:hypothetical protein B0H15DRAFT_148661 [Mycena belliae]